MANPTARSSAMNAAARAAAKRARSVERPQRPEEPPARRTLTIDPPAGDRWEDPPQQSPEPLEQDPDSLAEPEGSASAPRPVRGPLTAVLGVLLVAALVAASVLGWQYAQGRRTESARAGALTAARNAAPVVLSYDYRHLDRDFTRARERLTGHFREEYGKTTTSVVGPTAKKYHGVVKATVAAASVASASPDRVTVLLFVNQVTRSTQVSGSRLDLNRVRMTMTRTSGDWKVSAVDAL
jgi:Mce-associated membrane protein